MNRLKLWLYVVLLLGAGAGNLYFLTGWLTARSVAHIDRELRSSAAVADARIRLLGAAASSVADAAARAPTVVAAFADPAASPLAPAEEAVFAASEALGPDSAARNGLVAVAGTQGVSARSGGSGGKTITAPEALLVEAQAGRRTQAWVRLDGTLWMVAAVPAGRGGAVAVGIPLDAPFTQGLRGATGVDFTVAVDGKVAASTLAAPEAAEAIGTQASNGRRPVDVGRLGRVKAALDWPAPAMPILFADPPAMRALALPLEGAGAAALVITQATAPFFSGLAAYQLLALVAMALFLLVGVLLGLFMSEESGEASFPRELVAAADRVARGDFTARAPALAGSAGMIATALNRASEAAQHGRHTDTVAAVEPPVAAPAEDATQATAEEPAATAETVSAAEPAPQTDEADAGAAAPASPDEAAVAAQAALLGADTTQAAEKVAAETSSASEEPWRDPWAGADASAGERTEWAHASAPAATAEGEEQPVRFAGAEATGRDAALESATSPEPAVTQEIFPPFGDEDESHWRSVYDDFLRLRGVTGEPAEGVSYERFRSRLERNREQLKDKHGARTVRFQPYVKDGKVALRATPVR